jgi:uncharacterized protein YecE (DUF72 family)
VEFRIGTGGWQYFPIESADKLRGYSKLFDFVEVNSTFYRRVPLGTVRRWREAVPEEFEFSVKCSRDVTDSLLQGDRPGLAHLLSQMEGVCAALDSNLLVLQTPARLDPAELPEGILPELLDSVKSRSLKLAWEVRSVASPSTLSLLESRDVVDVVDLSHSEARSTGDVLYSRLFGLGRHNLYRFTPQDFDRIEERARSSGAKKAYFAFHGVAMYVDALGFKRSAGANPSP